MHDSDCVRKAFTLSLLVILPTRERPVRHSDWLYRLFFTCENRAYRFVQMSFMEWNSCVICDKIKNIAIPLTLSYWRNFTKPWLITKAPGLKKGSIPDWKISETLPPRTKSQQRIVLELFKVNDTILSSKMFSPLSRRKCGSTNLQLKSASMQRVASKNCKNPLRTNFITERSRSSVRDRN